MSFQGVGTFKEHSSFRDKIFHIYQEYDDQIFKVWCWGHDSRSVMVALDGKHRTVGGGQFIVIPRSHVQRIIQLLRRSPRTDSIEIAVYDRKLFLPRALVPAMLEGLRKFEY